MHHHLLQILPIVLTNSTLLLGGFHLSFETLPGLFCAPSKRKAILVWTWDWTIHDADYPSIAVMNVELFW
jgi:hypothetical protein